MIEFVQQLMGMGHMIWSNYWIVIWFSPVLWAAVIITDSDLTNRIYQDKFDGTIVSSLIPLVVFLPISIASLHTLSIDHTLSVIALFLGGVFLTLNQLFYFASLKVDNDATFAELVMGVSIPLIALGNFIFLDRTTDEILVWSILAFVLLTAFHLLGTKNNRPKWHAIKLLFISALFLSLSILFAEWGYKAAPALLGTSLFFLGVGCAGVLLWVYVRMRHTFIPVKGRIVVRTGILELFRRHWKYFLAVELVALVAYLSIQRALDLGDPSIASVADALGPLFAMGFSVLGVVLYARYELSGEGKALLEKQYEFWYVKIGLLLAISFTVLMLTL